MWVGGGCLGPTSTSPWESLVEREREGGLLENLAASPVPGQAGPQQLGKEQDWVSVKNGSPKRLGLFPAMQF